MARVVRLEGPDAQGQIKKHQATIEFLLKDPDVRFVNCVEHEQCERADCRSRSAAFASERWICSI